MQIITHAAARATLVKPTSPQDPLPNLARLGVRALLLLAEEKLNPPADPAPACKSVESLRDEFSEVVCELPQGGEDEEFIRTVHAVLCFATFAAYRRNYDTRFMARECGVSFLKLRAYMLKASTFPSSWAEEIDNYDPTNVKPSKPATAPASDGVPPSKAVGAWKGRVADHVAARRKGSTPSKAIDALMKLTGLEEVKSRIVDMYDRLLIAKEQGTGAASYNIRLDGNPGTGKTTVARLYCKFLVEMGVLPEECTIKETSGSKLITDGVRGLTALLDGMKEEGGGVVFVDETYQLNPQTDASGRQVLDFILPHAEKLQGEYGKIVWIFAGYADKMDKLFEHNPGLPSRFPYRMVFQDYTDAELMKIMLDLMGRGGQEVAPATPAVAKPKPAAKKPATVNMTGGNSNGYNPYGGTGGYGGYGSYDSHPDQKDQWGNTWSWDKSTSQYKDDYGNTSGYGCQDTSRPLGSSGNPIINQDSLEAWEYDMNEKVFYKRDKTPRVKQSWYPGSPRPAAPQPVARAFTVDDIKWVRVATRRLGRMRGKVGFGNARAVRILFEASRDRLARRITELRSNGATNVDVMQFTRDDLLGPKANKQSLLSGCTAWTVLQGKIGLGKVKAEMEKLVDLAVVNADLEDREMPTRGVALNRIFLGNPGTGKTTVAKLYAEILCHLGLLSKGDVVLKNSSDFVGGVIGSSEQNTRSILAASEGCVLVIDEAYSLNPSYGSKSGGGSGGTQDPYRTAVIDTIVEQVQGRPGEDRAVVMLGYRKEMEDMLAVANPGLSRRFQLENAFEFEDYTDEQLTQILLNNCRDERLDIDLTTAAFAISQLATARSMPNFGNAGAVDNILSEAKKNMGARSHLMPEDFCPGGVLPKEGGNEQQLFADLVADPNILDYIQKLQAGVRFAAKRGTDAKENVQFNLLFVGAPGTGKTTVARRMGEVYKSLGLLPTSDVVEISAKDLIAGFVGQSQQKASDVLHRAKGKVLFIDEAYQLNPMKGGSFMQEAVDTMVKELTSEELMGKLVVILAGYEQDIDDMLEVNGGLVSRFSQKLHFANFTVERVEELLTNKLREKALVLSEEASESLRTVCEKLCAIGKFSNGRDVETFVKEIVNAYAVRTGEIDGDPDVEVEDLNKALGVMVRSRTPSTQPLQRRAPPQPPQQLAYAHDYAHAPPPPATQTRTQTATAPAVTQATETEEPVQEAESGFSGADNNQFYSTLQRLLDQRGLNTKEGVARLTSMDLNDRDMLALANEIASVLNIDLGAAQDLLREWQTKQLDVQDKLKEEKQERELAKKQKRKALVPIWRCAVCGRADLNYIFCYVSPYIVRYDEVTV
jgi:SpoVK/Ycf46/Vps4 family AAA+-type ATPase